MDWLFKRTEMMKKTHELEMVIRDKDAYIVAKIREIDRLSAEILKLADSSVQRRLKTIPYVDDNKVLNSRV